MEKKIIIGEEGRAAAEAGNRAEIQSDRNARRRSRESRRSVPGS